MCRQQQHGGLASLPGAEIRTTLSDPTPAAPQTKTTKRRVEKKVSFSQRVEVEEILSRRDMTETELKATWYDHLDLLSILIEIKDIINDAVESLPPVECWLPWTRRSRCAVHVERSECICTRGLEHEIDREAHNARSANKKRFYSLVIDAQKRYSTKISKISERHSQQAKDHARRMGKVDEETAADIYYQDMVRGMPLFDY